MGATRTCLWLKGSEVVLFKAGDAEVVPRNPVRGDQGSLTSFNPAGVGSFGPGNRPNRA
jgi:hypothetical protein